MIYCDMECCRYNEGQQCTAAKAYVVCRRCRTYKNLEGEDAAEELMQPGPAAGCHKVAGKYKANHGRLVR